MRVFLWMGGEEGSGCLGYMEYNQTTLQQHFNDPYVPNKFFEQNIDIKDTHTVRSVLADFAVYD